MVVLDVSPRGHDRALKDGNGEVLRGGPAGHMIGDPFNPAFLKDLDDIAERQVEPRRDDPNLQMWFAGNEIGMFDKAQRGQPACATSGAGCGPTSRRARRSTIRCARATRSARTCASDAARTGLILGEIIRHDAHEDIQRFVHERLLPEWVRGGHDPAARRRPQPSDRFAPARDLDTRRLPLLGRRRLLVRGAGRDDRRPEPVPPAQGLRPRRRQLLFRRREVQAAVVHRRRCTRSSASPGCRSSSASSASGRASTAGRTAAAPAPSSAAAIRSSAGAATARSSSSSSRSARSSVPPGTRGATAMSPPTRASRSTWGSSSAPTRAAACRRAAAGLPSTTSSPRRTTRSTTASRRRRGSSRGDRG